MPPSFYGEKQRPGKGLTCWDLNEKCTLDCLMPAAPEVPIGNADVMSACLQGCADTASVCVDSKDTVAYVKCAYGCAARYDAALMACLEGVSETAVGTYGVGLDACSNLAAGEMDDCMDACYGADRYGDWTPEAEEGGRAVHGINGEQWRRPFRDPAVVYGSQRVLTPVSDAARVTAASEATGAAATEEAAAVAEGASDDAAATDKAFLELPGAGEERLAAVVGGAPGGGGTSGAFGGNDGGSRMSVVAILASAAAVTMTILGLGMLALRQLSKGDADADADAEGEGKSREERLQQQSRRRELYL
ncbi:unnamed protein product [Phaeothamnion confervicola]